MSAWREGTSAQAMQQILNTLSFFTSPSTSPHPPTLNNVPPSPPHRAPRLDLLSSMSLRPRRALSHQFALLSHRAAHPLPRPRPLLREPQPVRRRDSLQQTMPRPCRAHPSHNRRPLHSRPPSILSRAQRRGLGYVRAHLAPSLPRCQCEPQLGAHAAHAPHHIFPVAHLLLLLPIRCSRNWLPRTHPSAGEARTGYRARIRRRGPSPTLTRCHSPSRALYGFLPSSQGHRPRTPTREYPHSRRRPVRGRGRVSRTIHRSHRGPWSHHVCAPCPFPQVPRKAPSVPGLPSPHGTISCICKTVR
jgi:hypothetical protein